MADSRSNTQQRPMADSRSNTLPTYTKPHTLKGDVLLLNAKRDNRHPIDVTVAPERGKWRPEPNLEVAGAAYRKPGRAALRVRQSRKQGLSQCRNAPSAVFLIA